jgi:hypothetical protein
MVQRDRNRWQYRARAYLRLTGPTVRTGGHCLRRVLEKLDECQNGIETRLLEALDLCHRQQTSLGAELEHAWKAGDAWTRAAHDDAHCKRERRGNVASSDPRAGSAGRLLPNSRLTAIMEGDVSSDVAESDDCVGLGELVGVSGDELVDVLVAAPDEVAPVSHVSEGTCPSSCPVPSDSPDSLPSPATERAPPPSTMATLHSHRHLMCMVKTGSMPRMTRLFGRAKRRARIA